MTKIKVIDVLLIPQLTAQITLRQTISQPRYPTSVQFWVPGVLIPVRKSISTNHEADEPVGILGT